MDAARGDDRISSRSGRRLYGPALVLGLLAAIAMTVGASHPWVSATGSQPGLPTVHADATGTDLAPLAGALGVVVLAGFGAVIATRGWVRRVLGLLIVVGSAVVAVSTLVPSGASDVLTAGLSAKGWTGGSYQTSTEAWRWLVLAAAIVAIAAGATTFRYGGDWAVMGSRYDAPGPTGRRPGRPAEALSEADVWQAIDEGDDPTQGH